MVTMPLKKGMWMSNQPIIFAIDDEPMTLGAIVRDLQSRYGDRFQVMRAETGVAALEALAQLQIRNRAVALFIVDQRMPAMTGVEFLTEALELYPDAKRVLLTAYADTSVAIKAINDLRLDHYLLKPWDPPEEHLYPVLDDLLQDWLTSYVPPFEGVRLVGHRWSAAAHDLKDFLSRNLVPFQWLDIERDADAGRLMEYAGAEKSDIPLVVFSDGEMLKHPAQMEVAERLGLETAALLPSYDLIIIGAGPAGLAGAVYGASEGLKTLVIERHAPGGQAGMSSRIENYLGFPSGLSGADLARRAVAQAKRLGAEILTAEVVKMRIEGQYRIVVLSDGTELSCTALLVTAGVSYRQLDAPGIERLRGAGVYYGGTLSEAPMTQGEDVFIVGGANSAGQAAVHFARYARSVTILVRGDSLAKSGMSQYLADRIEGTENINVWRHAEVAEALGEDHLEALRIKDTRNGCDQTVPAGAVFIFIGAKPYTDWFSAQIAVDPGGYVLTGPDMRQKLNGVPHWPLQRDPFLLETNVPGVFVAGDIRHRSMKRIASATGEGAMAIHFVHQYLSTL
jgi:thioredoxin reductase (NADPH)